MTLDEIIALSDSELENLHNLKNSGFENYDIAKAIIGDEWWDSFLWLFDNDSIYTGRLGQYIRIEYFAWLNRKDKIRLSLAPLFARKYQGLELIEVDEPIINKRDYGKEQHIYIITCKPNTALLNSLNRHVARAMQQYAIDMRLI